MSSYQKPKVLILDTSILSVWLRIPGFDRCGRDEDTWDYQRIAKKIDSEIADATSLVLPLATIIETGNHISQATGDRFTLAQRFTNILRACVNNDIPWAAFSEQTELWNDEALLKLADVWPGLAAQKFSLGDATISNVAQYYAKAGNRVEILTGDQGLKSYEPIDDNRPIPRRRK